MPLDRGVIPELRFNVKDALYAIARAWNTIPNSCIKAGLKYILEYNVKEFDLGKGTNILVDEVYYKYRSSNFLIDEHWQYKLFILLTKFLY